MRNRGPYLRTFLTACGATLSVAAQANVQIVDLPAVAAQADLQVADRPATLTGKWSAGKGAEIVLTESQQGVLDVHGHDWGSVFRLVCIVDRGTKVQAECVGDGVSHEGTLTARFTYRGTFSLKEDGSLAEDWQVRHSSGTSSGQAVFRRETAASR